MNKDSKMSTDKPFHKEILDQGTLSGASYSNIEPLWTVQEVADYLRLKPETVRSMARRDELPAVKLGRVWRFRSTEIVGWIDENITETAG